MTSSHTIPVPGSATSSLTSINRGYAYMSLLGRSCGPTEEVVVS